MPSIEEIKAELAKAQAKSKDLVETKELFLPQLEQFEAQAEYLRLAVERIKADHQIAKDGVEHQKTEIRAWDKKIVAQDNEVARLQRLLHRAAAEEAARRALLDEMSSYDEIVATAYWRDKIKQHQLDGSRRMAAMKKGLVGDKRGLGKSLQSIAWADMVKAKRLLILAPRKSAINLRKELALWSPHRPPFYFVGSNKVQRDMVLTQCAAANLPVFTVIINLESWGRDKGLVDKLAECRFDTVIIDEAHAIKDTKSLMYKGVKSIVHRANICPGCNENSYPDYDKWAQTYTCRLCGERTRDVEAWYSVKNLLPMTGSPIMNRPTEMWPLLNLIDPKGFPKEDYFKTEFLQYDWENKEYVWDANDGEARLVEKLGMRYIARTPEDAGIEKLPISEELYEVEFSPESAGEQWAAYQKLQDDFEAILDTGETMKMTEVIAQLQKLQMLLLWPPSVKQYQKEWDFDKQRYVNSKPLVEIGRLPIKKSVILDAADSLIRELVADGERVVVFSKFKDPLGELASRLSGDDNWDVIVDRNKVNVATLTGDTNKELQQLIITDFDARTYSDDPTRKRAWDVVLCTYAAAGESLNFTDASCVVMLEPHFNPERRSQAIGRVDRMGQTKSVKVYDLTTRTPEGSERTVYEWLEAINERKRNIIDGFENEVNLAEEIIKEMRAGRR